MYVQILLTDDVSKSFMLIIYSLFFGRDKTFYSPCHSLVGMIHASLLSSRAKAILMRRWLSSTRGALLLALPGHGLLSRPPSLEQSERRGGQWLTNSQVVLMFERSENIAIAIACRQSLLRQWRSIFLLWVRSTIKGSKVD